MQIRLSQTEAVSIKMPFKGAGGQLIEAVLTQQAFEGMSAKLFRRLRDPLDDACQQVCLFSSAPFPIFLCCYCFMRLHLLAEVDSAQNGNSMNKAKS